MSEQQNFGFGKFVPGFDFLQNLSKGAAQPQAALSNLSNWVAPTLNVEELDKRIGELKAVSFWLDQNAKALAATIQALELQKMTLATLKGMNFDMASIANALKLQPAEAATATATGDSDGSVAGAATEAVARARAKKKEKSEAAAGGSGQPVKAVGGVVDPLQWWGALTQQFQQIAAGALQDAAKTPAAGAAREMAGGVTGKAMQAATDIASAFTGNSSRKSGAAGKKTAAAGKSAGARSAARKSGSRSR